MEIIGQKEAHEDSGRLDLMNERGDEALPDRSTSSGSTEPLLGQYLQGFRLYMANTS
jgi:hypothetical protein